MKQNLWTGCLAVVMVLLAAGVLFMAMSLYEKDKFDESWLLSPTVIEKELKPLYSDELDMNSTEY
ncbi:MAG: hypothetical protein IKA09_03105 [Lachnospiraceae bacterium]|nr:hypothetical protein [Lachnospiraceae bacterium]